MGKSYLSEQQSALTANIIVLVMQTLPISMGFYDFMSQGLFLLLSGLVALPLLYDAYKKVKLNNYLIGNGEIIEAKLHQDETKVIPLRSRYGGGVNLLKIQCSVFTDGIVHIFRDEYTCRPGDTSQIVSRLKEADSVLVCTDSSFKTYKILFHSVLHELYDNKQVECPRILNYIILIINIIIVVISLFNAF